MAEITWRAALKLLDKNLIEKAIKLPDSKKRTKKDKLFFIVNGEEYPAKRNARAAWDLKESDVKVKWKGAGGTKVLEDFYKHLGYETVKYEGEGTSPKSKTTLFLKACDAITKYVDENGISGDSVSRADVLKIVRKVYPEIKADGSNMSPSDICYNRCNGYQMTKDFAAWPHALEYSGRAQYRLLGSDYPYTGDVIWDRDKEEIVFGSWFEGVFREYESDEQITVSEQAEENKRFIESTEKLIAQYEKDGFDRETVVKLRVNQDVFRKKLLLRYDGCCICGISAPEFLVASHIKPWSECNGAEKTDVNNGLLLCPNHDKLFDQGYISFDKDGKIMISDLISESDRELMNISDGDEIRICESNEKYLEYHRTRMFKK